jgi:hypothetical protein
LYVPQGAHLMSDFPASEQALLCTRGSQQQLTGWNLLVIGCHTILRRWYDMIALHVHEPMGGKSDDEKDSYCGS